MNFRNFLIATTAALLLAACGGGGDAEDTAAAQDARSPQAASATPAARQVAKSFTSLDGVTTVPYLEYLPADYASSGKTYPVLIFLHGGSGVGTSDGSQISKVRSYPIPAMIDAGNDMCFTNASGAKQCFIVLSPQSTRTTGTWNINDTGGMVNYALANYRVDTKRIYVTGVSMGGGGAWSLLAGTFKVSGKSTYGAAKIAAAAPIATGAPSASANTGICSGIVANHVAVWAFHNSGDPVAALSAEQGWVNKVNLATTADGYACSAAGNPAAQLTIYQANTHEGWTTTYDVNHQVTSGMNVFQWLLSNTK